MKQSNLCKRMISCAIAFVMLLSLVPTVALASTPTGSKEKTWAGIADGDVLVKDTITQIANGVVEHEVVANTTAGNDQKIDYMCRVQLSDSIKIVACYGQDNADRWGMYKTTQQAAYYEENHPGETVVAGINADFFNMGTGEPMGALVMDGKICHGANNRWYFAILKDGTPVIRNSPDLSDCQQAVGGWVPLVKDGQLCTEYYEYGADDYSRCTIGIMEDGSVVTSVTHGRLTPVSCGRTYKEIAEMYQRAGCVDALILDGGGSATYAARIEGSDKLEVRNSPSDGAEREVSSTLLIVSTAEKTGEFDHVAITPNNELYTPGYEVQFEASGVDTAGFPMDIPEGVTWALADDSVDMGTIDADTGKFVAGEKTGTVTVQMMKDGEVMGSTTIEIAIPDHIYFNSEEVSLGFEAESDLTLVVRNKDRDMHIKDGDLIWNSSTEGLGTFNGNIFVANADNSLNGTVTAVSAYDSTVSGSIHVIVGMLPTVVWDFEDYTNPETGEVIPAADYYCGEKGILSTSNYGRGGKESIEIADLNNDDPVRFGSHSLKLNFDFTNCGAVTEGACVGTTDEMAIPGAPTGLGVWVYAPEGVGVPYGSVKDAEGNLISGLWLRCYCYDGSGTKCEVNFTLEPKTVTQDPDTGEWLPSQPGIYWEGWQYLEADLTQWTGPFSFMPGMTFRLMFVNGIRMVGTQRTGELYFDNFQFVYGTNIDDTDAPVVDSIRVNDEMLEDGDVLTTDTLNINAYFHDVENKYTTGIDAATIRMYVDGINVVDNDRYQYVPEPDGSIAHLYDVKLADGEHSVTVSLRDGFGNETTETRYFTVNTGAAVTHTGVSVIPAEDAAILGKTVSLNIKATGSDVQSSTTMFSFNNLFKNYEVKFSENYEGTYSYSKLTNTLTVNAERKADAAADDGNVIASVVVSVPSNLSDTDKFLYIVKGGCYTTTDGTYDTYCASEASLPVEAAYQISAEPVLVGMNTSVTVTDNQGKPAANVDLCLAETNEKIGTTDENGVWNTDYFSAASGTTVIYAMDADGALSFQCKINSYDAAGEANAMPFGLVFNAMNDAAHGKSMSWMSNAILAPEQNIRYRVSGTDAWTTEKAEATLRTFSKGGNCAVNVNSIVLKGLDSGTVYEYQIGGDEAWSEIATFTTVSVEKNETNFFVLGDIQAEDTTNIERITNTLGAGNYDFGIQTGDAVDDATAYSHWNDITELFGAEKFGSTDMIHVLGNHEYAGDANASTATNFFNLPTQAKPGSYYSLTYGDVYMAVVNYTGTASQLKEAMDWLLEDASASDAVWKVLLMHQPAYYTNAVGGNAEIYNAVPDVAEAAGINVVFSGHDHSAARTNPLRNDEIDADNGIYYYICGSSGEKSYSITSQNIFDYNKVFKFATTDFTATYLTVNADEDRMTINYYDIDRGLIDSVTLETPCTKNGHDYHYNLEDGCAICDVCGRRNNAYSGEIVDNAGNHYYLLGGVLQTGWFMLGDDVYYANSKGVLQEVTLTSDVATTCTVRGKMIYSCKTVDAGDESEYTVYHASAPGHTYDKADPKEPDRVCTVCGWHEVSLNDCQIRLAYTNYMYTGKQIKPRVYVTAPDGTELASYYDFTTVYGENTECGYGKVTVKPKNDGYYVNVNQRRGTLCDDGASAVLTFTIHATTVKNVRSSMTNNGIRVTWTPVAEADGYHIYLWNSAKQAYVKDKSVTGGNTSAVTVYGVTAGKSYDIKVCAYNKVDNGEVVGYGNSTHITVPKNYKKALTAPAVTAGNAVSSGCVKLTWAKVYGADKYEIYRANTKDGTYKLMYTTTNTTYTNTSSKPGYTYYYKVKAVDSTGNYQPSAYSAVVSRTCDCARPVVRITTSQTSGKPYLSWDAVDGADKYVIYRSTDGVNYIRYSSTAKTTYTNTSTVAGTTYYYKVQAISSRTSYADSALSTRCYITCDCARPVVKITTSQTSGKPYLSWDAVDGADKYVIYRSTDGVNYIRYSSTAKTTYTNTSTVAGKTYYYKVQAISSVTSYADSALSTRHYITCDCARPVVSITTGQTSGKPYLSWSAVDGADKYVIYRSTDGENYTRYDSTTKTTYTNTSALAGTTYYYKVQAISSRTSYANSALSIPKSVVSK